MKAALLQHLIILPIVLPLLSAAVLMLLSEKRRALKACFNLLSTLGGLALAVTLLFEVQTGNAPGSIGVYLPGNWQAPLGIVLVVDRLSALMLVLSGILGSCALLFAMARWDRAGAHFHALFQVQLLGLYGAFLTADLFNLFVFFEVLLAASYGLMLHGSGKARVSAGLHYIVINLLASSLFLIGAALIYGVTGTLNMADLAVKVPLVSAADRGLLHAGIAILASAFLTKAGMWPLNFWLVPAYSAASAPVAALFAIMTKVGIYALLRLSSLVLSTDAGDSAHFGSTWLLVGGLLTMAFAAISILAAQRLERLASLSILVSAGTLLAVIGAGQPLLVGGGLFYLISSTLALCALFLLAELIERSRSANNLNLDDDLDQLPPLLASLEPPPDTNLDDQQRVLVGRAIPWPMAFLGLAFIGCALLVVGMPPLSGFIGKFSILHGLLNPSGLGQLNDAPIPAGSWALIVSLVCCGLASLIALSRVGILRFWSSIERPSPLLRPLECLPVIVLLVLCSVLTLKADPVLRYTEATALDLATPGTYIQAVINAQPVPYPSQQQVQP